MADVSKLNINNIDYDIKDPKSRNPRWNEVDPSEQSLPIEGEYIGTSIKKITARLNDLGALAYKDNLSDVEIINYLGYTPADDAEFHREIQTLQENFQAGVDAIYNACRAKGSTPASKSLSDVVAGINNIPTGGNYMTKSVTANGSYYATDDGVDAYNIVQVNVDPNVCETLSITSNGTYDAEDAGYNGYKEITVNVPSSGGENTFMYPQEVNAYYYDVGGYGLVECYITLDYDTDIIIAHLYVNDSDNSITYNLKGSGTIGDKDPDAFSIVIDNAGQPIQATTTYSPCTLHTNDPSDLTDFIITCTLPTLNTGYHTLTLRSNTYGEIDYFQNILYGNNFESISPCAYLENGNFDYFAPLSLIIPTNPITYELQGSTPEDVCDVMNNNYSDTFDSGNSYYMNWITPYEEEGTQVPIGDTFEYDNGKLVYTHNGDRNYEDTVYEEHHFILPIDGSIFNYCKYINIHCRIDEQAANGYISVRAIERIETDEVEYSDGSLNPPHEGVGGGLHYDEFVVSLETGLIYNSDINFIEIVLTEVPTDSTSFTLEIDKIWGSNFYLGREN